MNSNKNQGFLANFKQDLPASLVVFLVAMPLCLGIALASGAPLFSGIISGIVGGIVVAAFSGSPLGVSGPAAGLAVIVFSAIQELGSFEIFLFALVIAGIIQFVFGLLKAGIIGYYFPSAVIKGMLSGIGIIIILKQIPHAFGYDKDPAGDLAFSQMDGNNTLNELIYMLNYVNPGAIIIAGISLAILVLWERPFMKRIAIFKIVQGPLVAVLVGIVLYQVFQEIPSLMLGQEQLVRIPVAENLSGFFTQFRLPDFSQWNNSHVYVTALTIAVVASLETLLCVEATDKLDPLKRVTPTNRELRAQGIGNVVAGLIGGLPVTQVIVRSSANIQSGGRSKTSAIIHGLLLLVSAMAIPAVLNMIPLASLAAILIVVGYKLAKPSIFKQVYAKGRSQFIPFAVTVVGIVFTDLLLGIALGMIVAIFHILWNNMKLPYHYEPNTQEAGEPIVIKLAEEVSFLNKASILQTLNHLPDNSKLLIDASENKTVHPDVIEIIEDFKLNAKTRNIGVEIVKLNLEKPENPVKRFGQSVQNKPKDNTRTF